MPNDGPTVGRSTLCWVMIFVLWTLLFGFGLLGCAATIDRSAQQSQMLSFISRCERLDQAGTFASAEAAMACWLKPTREMIVRDGVPSLAVFDAYSSEVLTLANLVDRGYLNEAAFHDHYRNATMRFSGAWSAQVQRSQETNSGPGIGTLVTLGLVGLLTSNPPSPPQAMMIGLAPPPPPIAPPINFQWKR